MDRSFLSQPEVVAASRSFVCIRLATYENAEEARLLKSIFTGGSGELENTTFAMLDPDGKVRLVRSGRSPRFAFYGATDEPTREMAVTMQKISTYYRVSGRGPAPGAPLPLGGDPRLALNVASCDGLPLVALHGPDADARARLARTLAPLAWSEALAGRAVYTLLPTPSVLKMDRAPAPGPGLTVIAPDAYGQEGKVLAEIPVPSGETGEKLKAALAAALARFTPTPKEPRQHIGEGHQRGVFWKTLLPVTDPGPRGGRPSR